jgi:hypothetical protein
MRIILFFQLNMWAWLHNASLPGHPKALLALLDTYQSLFCVSDENWLHWRHPLLKKGMRNPDIIRNNSKNNRYNSEIIVK